MFYCTALGCTHRMERKYLLGKEILCPFCGSKFTINGEALKLAMPHCPTCKKGTRANLTTAKQALEKIFQEAREYKEEITEDATTNCE